MRLIPGLALASAQSNVLVVLADDGVLRPAQTTIPFSTALMELTLLHGWFVFDPSASNDPLGLVTTGGLAAVVGT